MKRLFSFFAVVMMTVSVLAEGHMKFKGVEIDGQLAPFVTALQKQNFSTVEQSADAAALSGIFNGEDVIVHVSASAKSHTVYQVVVVFVHSGYEWSTIWNGYAAYKDRLQLKYGEPTTSIEENRCSYSQDDPLYAIRMDQAEYWAMYKTDYGRILLSLKKLPYPLDVNLCITYVDVENWGLNENEVIEDL